jgi:UDP-N-acetyl-D-glucosamine/UDP-N-acetyl-D-galactosamine dehydrogenase
MMVDLGLENIAVIGLGYVGLPLAVEFSKVLPVVGFDIDSARIDSLISGFDETLEVSAEEIRGSKNLSFTASLSDIASCNVFIVTVPTPIDEYKRPDLGPLLSATKMVGSILEVGDVVIYESTVYPGATEDDCVPILVDLSGLEFNKDFHVGYSPERINPGDKKHRLTEISKVTSGSSPDSAEFVDQLYKKIIVAGTYRAESIKVAEAAKVIENTQRDLNIALVNEFAMVFNKLGINTSSVLAAAGSKWNFLPFSPGLVGGHCIGVDPYYLTHKAQSLGYHPEVILAGRRLNDNMGGYIAAQLIKTMAKKQIPIAGSTILVMGLTFKENCPDLRNSRVFDIVAELQEYEIQVCVYDPWVKKKSVENYDNVVFLNSPAVGAYDAIIIAVGHDEFKVIGPEKIKALGKEKNVVYDIKSLFGVFDSDLQL